MANTPGITGKFKQHALSALLDGKTQIRASLYLTTATIGPSTTQYKATGEVSGTGYTAKGELVTNANTAGLTGTIAFWSPSANIVYSGVTLATAFDCALLYDDAQTTPVVDRSIGSYTFGSQTVNNGDFTLTVPAHDSTNGLVRLN